MIGALPTSTAVEISIGTDKCTIPTANPRAAGVMSAKQAETLDALERWSRQIREGNDNGPRDVITRDEMLVELDRRQMQAAPAQQRPAPPVDLRPLIARVESLERQPKRTESTYVAQSVDLAPIESSVQEIRDIARTAGQGVVQMAEEIAALRSRVTWLEETLRGITQRLASNG